MRSLIVAVAQPKTAPLDVAANAKTHASAVRAAKSRLVIFPEMSLTGYELDAPLLDVDDPRLAPLVDACTVTGTVALVGAPVAGPHIATVDAPVASVGAPVAGPHIAMLVIDGDGVRIAYRKQYPHPTNEQRFRPGPGPQVVVVDGWRLGLGICRDTGQPQHPQDTAALGIDAYVAGVLESKGGDDIMGTRARQIGTTYGVWVAFAGFAGPTGSGFDQTAGRSGIWAPTGNVAARAGSAAGEMARATFVREPATSLR